MPGALTFTKDLEVPPDTRVWALDGDAATGVWCAGPGLLRRTPAGWVTEGPAGGYRDVRVRGPGDAWAVGGAGRIARLRAGAWHEERLDGGFEVTNVEAWDGGAVATAAGSEVWRTDGAGWARWGTEPLAGSWAGALWAGGPADVVVAAQPMRPASAPVLWSWDGGAWSPYDVAAVARAGFVSAVHGDGAEVWAVGYRPRLFGKAPLCLRRDRSGWAAVDVPARGALTDVRVVDGRAWIGTAAGALLEHRGGRWATHPTTGAPTAVHASRDRVWVVTDGRVVYTSPLQGDP